MNTKRFWNWLMMLVMALSMVGCGSDDDEKIDDAGEGGTTVITEFTATTEIKEVKLKSLGWNVANCTIYADFNYKYVLGLFNGSLSLYPFYRSSGKWELDSNFGNSKKQIVSVKDLGKQSAIISITNKNFDENIFETSAVAQPQHGYAMKFKTENDEWKYLRVYIKGYTLDDKETLSSITVQYQLY